MNSVRYDGTTLTIYVPGKFIGFWGGSGPGQGQDDESSGYPGGHALYLAIRDAPVVRVGKGYYCPTKLAGAELDAMLDTLEEYAEVCLVANSDEPDYGEVDAARAVAERVRFARGLVHPRA